MPTPTTLPDDLLTPIRPERPAGDDLRAAADWISIRNARPSVSSGNDDGIYAKQSPLDAGWPQLFDKASTAIQKKSKDLQLAIWLTEANTRLFAFAGVRDSLILIRELILRFWDSGLYPSADDGDIGIRTGPMQWLNDKFADLIRETPITNRNDGSPEYSYAHFTESRRTGGSITAAQFNDAIRLTVPSHFVTLLDDCQAAGEELLKLESVADAKFGPDLLSFTQSKEALHDCASLLQSSLGLKSPKSPGGDNVNVAKPGDSNSNLTMAFEAGTVSSGTDDSWEAAERLVRAGQVTEGLAEMTRLAATASSGRVKFHRKLLLADICLSTKRDKLAKSILEELAVLVDNHHLEDWEAPQVAGAVWSRLYLCCMNEKAGTADPEKAAQLFNRLCRLDPWQALACSDGT